MGNSTPRHCTSIACQQCGFSIDSDSHEYQLLLVYLPNSLVQLILEYIQPLCRKCTTQNELSRALCAYEFRFGGNIYTSSTNRLLILQARAKYIHQLDFMTSHFSITEADFREFAGKSAWFMFWWRHDVVVHPDDNLALKRKFDQLRSGHRHDFPCWSERLMLCKCNNCLHER